MTVRGLPDCARASRIVLKDYVNGKLKYCHAPLNVDQEEFHPTRSSHQFKIHDGRGERVQSKAENAELSALDDILTKEKVISLMLKEKCTMKKQPIMPYFQKFSALL
jgi:large subunit GTPase 1